MAIDPFVLKMQLRKALALVKGLRRLVSDADEDVIVHKLLEERDIAGYEIVRKADTAGFTLARHRVDESAEISASEPSLGRAEIPAAIRSVPSGRRSGP